TLKEEAQHILQEARMVLPGIQALFGFQMIAVFNQRYVELPSMGSCLHLAALILIALAIALIMAPAAYHRLAEPGVASRRLIGITSGLICTALVFLMLGLVLDIFVVCLFMTSNLVLSACTGLTLFCVFLIAWFLMPLTIRWYFQRNEKMGKSNL
ncbi:MAG TPA: DUF6328 family protein, partial [Burkholderiaceae bacterium]